MCSLQIYRVVVCVVAVFGDYYTCRHQIIKITGQAEITVHRFFRKVLNLRHENQ